MSQGLKNFLQIGIFVSIFLGALFIYQNVVQKKISVEGEKSVSTNTTSDAEVESPLVNSPVYTDQVESLTDNRAVIETKENNVVQTNPVISTPTPAKATIETISCAGLSVPLLPEKLNTIPALDKRTENLDNNGCTVNSTGCMCIRKDAQDRGVSISVLKTQYPDGFTLEMLGSTYSGKVDVMTNSDFEGNPALTMIISSAHKDGYSIKSGTYAFTEKGELISFDLSASSNTFTEIWPDFINKLKQGLQ